MVEINTSIHTLPAYATNSALQPTESHQTSSLRTIVTDGITISGEGQYIFEMDIYLQTLDKEEQDKAVDFLSKSADPLDAKALENFKQGQLWRSEHVIILDTKAAEEMRAKGPTFEPRDSLDPVIGVWPAGTAIFRLDGKKDYYPNQSGTNNYLLKAELEKLEEGIPDSFNIQDKVNLIGMVKNAIYAAETVQQSFDDVLNFNYMLEKARTTIDEINAPADLKTRLRDILNQGISYQNTKQSDYINNIQKYANNPRVGAEVRENIRMATAAQAYNQQLQAALKATHLSILNAGPLMNNLLLQHTDLIQFSPDKINEAIAFYKQDFDTYQDFVKNGYKPPIENPIKWDTSPLTEGHNYAITVIEEIKKYISTDKTIDIYK